MKRFYRHLLALAALLLVCPLQGRAVDDTLVELEQYIRYGLGESAALRSAFESYSAVSFQVPQASALPDPMLTYGYFLRSVETRVGPQRQKMGIAQSFPWFGTLPLKAEIVGAEANAEFNRFLALKNNLVFEIVKAYTELAYVDATIAITNETIGLVKSWEGILQERFRTGTGTHNDLIRVQVELGKLEDKLFELNDVRTPLSATLNALLNRDDTLVVTLQPDFLEISSRESVAEISVETMLSNNPELRMLDAVQEAKAKGVQLAEKKFYPDVTVGLDYIEVGDRDVADGGDDAIMGMVSLNLPINLAKNRAAVGEAKAKERSVREMRKDKEHRLRAELSRAHYSVRESKRKMALYRNTLIPKTQESIEASYTAYQAGDSGFLDVIDSEERLLEFQLTLKRAQADHIIAVTTLRKLAGSYNELRTASEKE